MMRWRSRNSKALLRSKGFWSDPQPWLFTFLGGGNAERVAGKLMQGLSGDDLGAFGRITFYPMETRAFRSPLVRMPDDDIAFPFNVVRIPGRPVQRRSSRWSRKIVRCTTASARPAVVLYPVSAFAMSSEDWKEHFGSRWPLLAEARRRYDPDNVLTPGYEAF